MMGRNDVEVNQGAARWLADACRVFLSGADTIVFSADAAQIAEMGPAHQLEPMLHFLASAERIGNAPEALAESWLASYIVTLLRNQRRFGFLQGIVDDCNRAGVQLLVLKGPVHVARVWHDPGLRPMIDMDLLCREKDLPAVTRIVRAAGFEALGKTSPFHLEFQHLHTGDRIELHFDVYEIFAQRGGFLDTIWEEIEIVEHADFRIPALSAECCLVFDLGHLLHNDLRINMRSLVDFAGQQVNARLDSERVQALLGLTDLGAEYDRVVSITDSLGWTGASDQTDCDLTRQLSEFWAGLPDDPGPGAMREMLYHPGVLRKIRKGFGVLFPPAAHLRQQSSRRFIPALRAQHFCKMVSGVMGDLLRGAGLNRQPTISLKQDVYRRRTGRRPD